MASKLKNSMLCRLEFFGLHRRALLSRSDCLRHVSGKRHHVDLDRALGIGGAVTNLLHALPRPKLNNSYQSERGAQQMDSLCPRLAAPVMPISSCCLASPRLLDHLQ